MTSFDFPQAVERLATALGAWAGKTRSVAKGDRFRLQGIDLSNRILGLSDLFFVSDVDHLRPRAGSPLRFMNQEILNTGTLRNSFFPQILAAHGQNMDLSLRIHFRGRFQVIVYRNRQGEQPTSLAEIIVSSDGPAEESLDLGSIHLLPRGSRLSWVARALNDSSELIDIAWEGRAPTATEGRMVVLIRTFGRTRDVQYLLSQFQEQAATGNYAQMLANTFFLVYDTSSGLGEGTYADLTQHDRLNSFVMTGPNYGGGGNMSVELLALQEAVAAAGVSVNELVITDDDLQISLESLSRNWGATLFRKDNAFHTLPVFMQSQPRRMWEDGGFWGRFTRENPTTARTMVAPRLLRHGDVFRGSEHLDEMSKLHHAEYSTFIFLSMPLARLNEIGLPVAFFLRGDDIELNLRHASLGGVTVSNPGLAAWHEPAHSYAQEYMSIAHGVIINMAYGQDKPDDLLAFFHARALSHLLVADVAGLTVYADVLSDLVAGDRLLVADFTGHYQKMMARYKAFDAAFAIVPDELVETLAESSKKRGMETVEANFLYMKPPKPTAAIDRVVLLNQHTERRNVYDPFDTERMMAVSAVAGQLYAALSEFALRYDELKGHYKSRLAETATPAFWQEVVKTAAFEVLHG